MPNTREKLVELLIDADDYHEDVCEKGCKNCKHYGNVDCGYAVHADHLIANGVTVQSDFVEMLSRAVSQQRTRIYGHDKEFNERMEGYNQSAFCVGFDYAMHLVLGLLTQVRQPQEGE